MNERLLPDRIIDYIAATAEGFIDPACPDSTFTYLTEADTTIEQSGDITTYSLPIQPEYVEAQLSHNTRYLSFCTFSTPEANRATDFYLFHLPDNLDMASISLRYANGILSISLSCLGDKLQINTLLDKYGFYDPPGLLWSKNPLIPIMKE